MINYHKYLVVTEQELAWGFYIISAGYSKTAAHQNYPHEEHPATHSFKWGSGRILDGYYLVYISRGEGVFESAHMPPTTVKAGTCFFLYPGEWHRYKPDEKLGWEEYWVGFKGTYPDQLMKSFFYKPQNPFIAIGLNEEVQLLFHQLLKTIQNGARGYHQIIAGITMQLIGTLQTASSMEDKEGNPTHQLIERARFMIRESLETDVDMMKIARSLPLGYSKFRKLFKERTDQSPHQYLLSLRIQKASELLKDTSLSINEIAYQTGFDNAFHFSKQFKLKTSMPPTRFRTTHQEPK